MKTQILLVLSSLFLFNFASAEDIYRIYPERNYESYREREMKRRIWELERAVAQLQERVFQLEKKDTVIAQPVPPPTPDSWVCTINAMGDNYIGTGGSKAVATARAVENCTKARKDSFFCKEAKCEQ